jgi:importin subunit alpha-1
VHWDLTNIAIGTSDHTKVLHKVVMESGAAPLFVHFISSPNNDVREQAIWNLGKNKTQPNEDT